VTTAGQISGLVGTLLGLGILIPLDTWVFLDAQAHERRGRPVVARIGTLEVETAQQWLLGCVALLVFFLPAYLTARSPSS
jgi:hypothetical protein